MRNLAVFILLFGVWLLWSGHTEPLMLAFGVGSCALVVWLSARLHILDEEAYPFELVLRLSAYLPWVFWQVILSNIDVAKIILRPQMRVRSQLVHIDVKQRTELGQAIHANTITLTPGTFTLDVRDNTFLIHALTADFAAVDSTGDLDDRVARLEAKR